MYSSSNEYMLDLIRLCKLCADGCEPFSESLGRLRENERRAESFPTLFTLQSVFGLSECEVFCVMLALGCELDGGLRNQMQEMCGLPLPSFDAAFAIWSREYDLSPGDCVAYAHPESPLRLFIFEDYEHPSAMMCAPLKLRGGILCYLSMGQIPSGRYYGFLRLAQALPLHQPAFLRICEFAGAALNGSETGYVYICGKAGTGKRSLAAKAAAELGLPLMHISANAMPAENDALRRLSRELAADAALSGAALYVEDYAPQHKESLRRLLEFFPKRESLLFVAGETAEPPYINGRPVYTENVGALSKEDLRLAAGYFGAQPPPGDFPDYLRLSVSELRRALQNARLLAASDGREGFAAKDFALSARQIVGRIPNAQMLDARVTLDDIILPPATREKLDLFCQFVRKSEAVRESWGFSRIQAYGKGIVGLFCGASGTGKTMAAGAIANSLGLKLMRIDISKIFDKYIGETEKRLSQLFEEAASQNCVLFFDEADALFSKRTEISSSHDRYANVETSFLLQCIEEFNGVTILATNLFQNFDEAFMRRITVIARFNMPGEGLRLDMWRRFFPPETPLAADVDLSLLAKELELSPAIIKAAAFASAILASGDGGAVSMRHILSALENELGKWGRESMLKELEMSL